MGYDVATEDKQVAWKHLILSFMERYFYLICFATYALEFGPGGYEKSFQAYMDEHKELRTMIEEGKDKLEWYRTVDASKLEHLKEIINAPNYKDNLGVLIRTIYDFAFVTYADLPRGAIKNNSMRRLAATTLMDILPPDIAERVNKKMGGPQQFSRLPFLGWNGLLLRLWRCCLDYQRPRGWMLSEDLFLEPSQSKSKCWCV